MGIGNGFDEIAWNLFCISFFQNDFDRWKLLPKTQFNDAINY